MCLCSNSFSFSINVVNMFQEVGSINVIQSQKAHVVQDFLILATEQSVFSAQSD